MPASALPRGLAYPRQSIDTVPGGSRILSEWLRNDPARAARNGVQFAAGPGAYVGAQVTRGATRYWSASPGDADSDTVYDLPELRRRSRDLLRNAPLSLGAVNTNVTNVVGTGLGLQCHPVTAMLGWDAGRAGDWSARVEQEFALWAGSKDCDITRTQNFYELQALAFRAVLESGDVLAILPRIERSGVPYATTLQLIEADRVSNPDNKPNTDTLVAGIEKDTQGAPVRYWISDHHPGALRTGPNRWASFDAFGQRTGRRNVLHLFDRLRPDQTRGVPYLAPVVEMLKQIDTYTGAELMAAVVDASLTLFVERSADYEAPTTGNPIEIQQGQVVELDVGESVNTRTPNRPNAAFDPFMQAMAQQVGVALNLPFEVLIKHFTSSYSASRAALLQAWKFFWCRRSWLAANFCQPVYETWLAEAVALGRIEAPGFFNDPFMRAAYCKADWTGDGPGSIDPLREAQAAKERMAIELTTLADEIGANDGGDWEAKLHQRARERDLRDKLKLPQPGAPLPPAAALPADTNQTP